MLDGLGNEASGEIAIASNGNYDVTAYASAEVNVPNPSTGTLPITSNNTYDVTQYAFAEVNVPGGARPDPHFVTITVTNSTSAIFSLDDYKYSTGNGSDGSLVASNTSFSPNGTNDIYILPFHNSTEGIFCLSNIRTIILHRIAGTFPTSSQRFVVTKTAGASNFSNATVMKFDEYNYIIVLSFNYATTTTTNPLSLSLTITIEDLIPNEE